MKKIILIIFFIFNISNTFAVLHLELKGGLAFIDNYDISGTTYSGNLSYTLGSELLYESSKSTEIGMGIAYKYNSPAQGLLYSNSSSDTMHLFDSVPIYGVAKYRFPEFKGVAIYGKVYLGMAMNYIGRYEWVQSVRPSLYTGFGLGAEYGNIIADMTYCTQETELTFVNPDTGNKESKSVSHSSLNLTVGYRLELPWFK